MLRVSESKRHARWQLARMRERGRSFFETFPEREGRYSFGPSGANKVPADT